MNTPTSEFSLAQAAQLSFNCNFVVFLSLSCFGLVLCRMNLTKIAWAMSAQFCFRFANVFFSDKHKYQNRKFGKWILDFAFVFVERSLRLVSIVCRNLTVANVNEKSVIKRVYFVSEIKMKWNKIVTLRCTRSEISLSFACSLVCKVYFNGMKSSWLRFMYFDCNCQTETKRTFDWAPPKNHLQTQVNRWRTWSHLSQL